MNRATRLLISLGLITLVVFGDRGRMQATGGYTIVDLGDFGGAESYGYDINSAGQVTGQAKGYNADYGYSSDWAFVYTNGALTNLGVPDPNGSGKASSGWAINAAGQVTGMFLYCCGPISNYIQHPFLYSNASIVDIGAGLSGSGAAINNFGDVAGSVNVTNGSHAFLYSGGVIADLGNLPNLPYATATALNNSRQVVGWSTKPNPYYLPHAFLYSDGQMVDLTPDGGDAWGINDAGQVTGFHYVNNGITYHAYIYSKQSGLTDLGTLDNASDNAASRAFAINAFGQVVGISAVPDPSASHAFLYSNGMMIDLGTLGGSTSWPGNDFYNHSINATGDVVGSSYLAGDSQIHAFLYRNGVMTDLNSLIPSDSGWTLEVANAINDSGQITGYGHVNGIRHAYLLTPATAAASLQSIEVTPANPLIVVGAMQGFVATGSYTDGSTKDLTGSVTWASATPSVATIGVGVATGVGTGTSTISAALNGVTGSTLLTVTRATTITTLTGAPNPSKANEAVTFTATVAGFAPTGTVTFSVDNGAQVLGPVSLTNAAAATTFAGFLPGTHSIVASYSGDSNNMPSTSASFTQVVDAAPGKIPTTTTLIASTYTPAVGQTVTLTATVTGAGPTGTVTFNAVNAPLATVPLVNGVATFLATFARGAHQLTATYNGDASNLSSTSANVKVRAQ